MWITETEITQVTHQLWSWASLEQVNWLGLGSLSPRMHWLFLFFPDRVLDKALGLQAEDRRLCGMVLLVEGWAAESTLAPYLPNLCSSSRLDKGMGLCLQDHFTRQLLPLGLCLLAFSELTGHLTAGDCSPWIPRAGPYPLSKAELSQQERRGSELGIDYSHWVRGLCWDGGGAD